MQARQASTSRDAAHGRKRGGALILALIAITAVAILGATTLQINRSITRREMNANDLKEAFYVAEAGLAEGYLGLRQGKSGRVGSEEAPARFGDGLFWVEVIDHGLGRYELQCTAMCGTGHAKLALLAERPLIHPAIAGVFSRSDVRLGAGTLIDGYDSRLGPYEEQADMTLPRPHTAGGGRLGSNGGVDIQGTVAAPSSIWGDVVPGPKGKLKKSANVAISGEESGGEEEASLAPVTFPELESLPALRHARPEPLILPPGEVGYDALTISAGSELVVQGPALIVVGQLVLEPSSSLTLDTEDGAIKIVVTQFLDLRAGSFVSTSGADPAAVTFAVAAEEAKGSDPLVQLHAEGRFHGSVYAPTARVTITSPFEVFGSVAADGLELGDQVTFHTDATFIGGEPGDEPLPGLDNWRILDLGRIPGGNTDPFQYIGVEPSTLPLPEDAHDLSNVCLHLDYRLAPAGPKQKYKGWEDEFDWNVVAEVLKIKRHEKDR